jgi:uncharacterized membrane protein
MSEINPYQAPQQQSVDAEAVIEPRMVPADHGWTWFKDGWTLFAKNPGIWILNVILLFLLVIAINLVPILGHLASPLLMPVWLAGMAIGSQALSRGEPLEVAHVFAGFKSPQFGQLVLVGLITLVLNIIVIAIVIFIAFLGGAGAALSGLAAGQAAGLAGAGMAIVAVLVALLLLIPVAMAWWFAPALVVLRNQSAVSAMILSFNGCLKNIIPFLIYGIVGLVLAIIASIPIFLGWLVLLPVTYASIYGAYRDIYPET